MIQDTWLAKKRYMSNHWDNGFFCSGYFFLGAIKMLVTAITNFRETQKSVELWPVGLQSILRKISDLVPSDGGKKLLPLHILDLNHNGEIMVI